MLINLKGISIGDKPRSDGRYQGYVTIKGMRHYVYAYSRNDVEDKIKNILKFGVNKKRRAEATIKNGIPQTFYDFTVYFYEKFRKKKIAESTYYNDFNRIKNYLKPTFGNKLIKKITPGDCQDLLDQVREQGKSKTAEELYSMLSVIFKGAIQHDIITKNPLNVVYKERHERQHGKALSSEEIVALKKTFENTAFMQPFMILLYTGLRPNELSSVRIEGSFVVAVNSKRKNKKVEYKKIPITPMLEPFIQDKLNLSTPDYLRRIFKQALPNHILYDLRTTFYSKCKECGVALPALNHFVGHSNGALGNTYTNLSDEYLIGEGKKIRF